MTDRRLVCDVTDLLGYFATNRAPMGVARVQMAILEAGLAAGLLEACAFDATSGAFREVPPGPLLALTAASRAGGPAEDPEWEAARRAAAGAIAAAPAFGFGGGDTLFALGAVWWMPDQLRRFRELRAAHPGLRLGFLFYDAIPLVVPEHCDEVLVGSFAGHMRALCLHADLVVAISRRSALDFERVRRELLPGVEIPVEVLGLDAPLPPAPGEPALPPWPRPYVLCVSTLESRKNQAMLLHAWLTLIRRHGEAAVPDLLLVGRVGFGAEAALRLLRGAPELRRKARHLEGVGDADLARLYAGCLFAVFNSFYEGWGLPVTEALSHGKLCLAPDHSSLREAGGEAALYFEPQSEPDLCDQAWRLIRDDAFRRAREAEIPARRALRSWEDLARGLRDLALAPRPELPEPFARAPTPLGRRLFLGRSGAPRRDPLAAGEPGGDLLREGEGWWEPEPWGVWARPGLARLRLRLGARPVAAPLRLHLELHAPNGRPMRPRFRLRRPGEAAPGPWLVVEHEGGGRPVCAALEVGPCAAGGDLLVEMDSGAGEPSLEASDRRRFGAGLAALMLSEAGDRAAWEGWVRGLVAFRDAVPEDGR